MKVTKIEVVAKQKENIEVGVSNESLQKSSDEVLSKKAKKKAMDLLIKRDYCESDLKNKLISYGYPPEVVLTAMDYVKSFGYVNDQRYITNYLRSGLKKKSRKQLEYELIQKGIAKDLISNCVEELQQEFIEEQEKSSSVQDESAMDLESQTIQNLILKKLGITINMIEEDLLSEVDFEKQTKLKTYLYRKGFPYKKINEVMKHILKEG